MFCPICSQEQTSDETRFCSRCGFLLTGISQLIASGGSLPQLHASSGAGAMSPRIKGIRQGALLFFLGLVIVPIASIITMAVDGEPFVAAAVFFLTIVGGILRMLYARLFESKQPGLAEESVIPEALKRVLPSKNQSHAVLPPAQSVPASSFVPPISVNRRETNDLASPPPPSVTEPTTNLLQKEI
jgi:hypothetical protein